jgi:hypothetical protein
MRFSSPPSPFSPRSTTLARARAAVLVASLALATPACGGDDSPPPPPPDAGMADMGGGGGDMGGGDVDMGGGDVDMGGGDVDMGARDLGADAGPVLPPLDAGMPFGDAGMLGEPAWVDLTVLTDGTSCPDLVPCGGDVLGTWDVTGGCFAAPLPRELMMCPGARVAGSGRARGRVTFADGIARRLAQTEVTVTAFIPAFCATVAGGCMAIEDLARSRAGGAEVACRTVGRGDCDCAIRQVQLIDDGDLYTTMGNQIVSTTSGKRWDYCVSGESMRYEDVSPSGAREPGVVSLGRR